LYRFVTLLLAASSATAVAAAGDAATAYRLDNPAQVLVLRDGALLVAERGTHNRLLRVSPATGRTSVFARGIAAPWGLGYARDGSILVSSTTGLYRLRRGVRPVRVAAVSISPFAVLLDGRIAYANETSVGLIAQGRAPVTLPVSVNAPHGLARLPDGTLAVSDTGNNRILRVDPVDGASTVISTSVTSALGLVAEPSGTLLTVEYSSGRLLRVDASGATTVDASGLRKPYALARARSGTVYVTEAGDLSRPTGSLRRVLPDGRTSVIRLEVPR
jgi:sugar lactone lactonase YvrE